MRIVLIVCIIIQAICMIINIWFLINQCKKYKEIKDAVRTDERNLRE